MRPKKMYTLKSNIQTALAEKPAHKKILQEKYPFFRHLEIHIIKNVNKDLDIAAAAAWAGLTPESLLEFFNNKADASLLKTLLVNSGKAPAKEDSRVHENTGDQNAARQYAQYISSLREATIDVRPILAGGKDPLGHIRNKLHSLKPDEKLTVISDFKPVPLQKKLTDEGYLLEEKHERRGGDFIYYSTFCAAPAQNTPAQKHEKKHMSFSATPNDSGFLNIDYEEILRIVEKLKKRNPDALVELDVREMAAPEPLEAILKIIHENSGVELIIVRHRQTPRLLPPALARLNWGACWFEKDDIWVYVMSEALFKEI